MDSRAEAEDEAGVVFVQDEVASGEKDLPGGGDGD